MRAVTRLYDRSSWSSKDHRCCEVAFVGTTEEWGLICEVFGHGASTHPPNELDMDRVHSLKRELEGLRRLPKVAQQLQDTLELLGCGRADKTDDAKETDHA